MARVLAISSQVARGHVGLSAIVPALQALGHEVIALPTVLLSNHPGHASFAGERVSPDLLRRMLDALEKNGWLGEVDAVLTGYLPSVEHVAFAREAVDRIVEPNRRLDEPRRTTVLCDPVLGDHPKGLYLDGAAAAGIRDQLLPMADIVTPNTFELGWLTGMPTDTFNAAIGASRKLTERCCVATSVTGAEAGQLVTSCTYRTGGGSTMRAHPDGSLTSERYEPADTVCWTSVERREKVPHGTGDLLSALLLGHWMQSASPADALARASAGVDVVVGLSAGRSEMAMAGNLWQLAYPPPMKVFERSSQDLAAPS